MGHELAHGVNGSQAGFAYINQSGALDESFADFFGAMIDRDDWLIGEDLYLSGTFMRSMENPELKGHPAHFSKLYRGGDDNAGVHSNSGISNRAFYLISEGLSSEGLGSSIGKEKTEKIAFATLAELSENSRFIDAAAKMIAKAEELYPESKNVKEAVELAWTSVGVTISSVPAISGGSQQFSLPAGDDIVAFLYPKDGTLTRSSMFSAEEYDVYLYVANQPLTQYSSGNLYGPINDYPASNTRPVMFTASNGVINTVYIGSDGKARQVENTGLGRPGLVSRKRALLSPTGLRLTGWRFMTTTIL